MLWTDYVLWTGYVLFQNDIVPSLLARVLGAFGEFPYRMMAKGKQVPQVFTQDGRLYQEIDAARGGENPDASQAGEKGRPLHALVPKRSTLARRLQLADGDPFLELVRHMLVLDPAKRPGAEECMRHHFLEVGYDEDDGWAAMVE